MDKFTINLIREGVMDMFQEVIKEAEKKYDHQSLSSLEVTCFIRETMEKRFEESL